MQQMQAGQIMYDPNTGQYMQVQMQQPAAQQPAAQMMYDPTTGQYMQAAAPQQMQQQYFDPSQLQAGGNPSDRGRAPCNTLYIGSLGDQIGEAQMDAMLQTAQQLGQIIGFQKFHLISNKAAHVYGFAVFNDASCASHALQYLKTQTHPITGRSLHVDFALNEYAVDKNASVQPGLGSSSGYPQQGAQCTLFLAQLDAMVTETAVQNLFGMQMGFEQLKLMQKQNTRGIHQMCWARYQTAAHAQQAYQNLQNVALEGQPGVVCFFREKRAQRWSMIRLP